MQGGAECGPHFDRQAGLGWGSKLMRGAGQAIGEPVVLAWQPS